MNKIHLVVFVHGMMGSRAHSVYVSERLVRKYPNIQTYISSANEGWLMNDGVDACGLRLAQENYISIVSPHLSIYIPYQEWYGRAINEIVKLGGCPITDQLSFCDSFREGSPLWEILADPAHEFYTALKKFKHKRNYVNTTGDFSVPYFAAAMDGSDYFDDPLNMNISCHSKYPSIITRFDIKETKECRREGYYSIHIDRKHNFLFEKHQNMNKEETMTKRLDLSKSFPEVGPNVKNRASYPVHCHSAQRRIIEMLKKIDWEQTLVHINSSKAHTMIIGIEDGVQEGKDVVEHFTDTFDY
ncbi:hypothetical protein BCV71DRAFT_245605 [Rhizopus microsporus]|uniref:DUF676 domain-containing protein n=1 Tax=Rhizopus microsporus TaxID=58291 RepID=A0A1X0RRV1_RHIZD|nr:hypothetical protein BCV71DRAFT_245605 [Rhizopus microsporus]